MTPVGGIKPAATVLGGGRSATMVNLWLPLVEQRFGKGRVAALTIGNLWALGDAPADAGRSGF